jgi:hypothetical protein
MSDPRGGEQAAGAGPGADQPRHLPLIPADPLPSPHTGHPLQQGASQIRPQGQHRPNQVQCHQGTVIKDYTLKNVNDVPVPIWHVTNQTLLGRE